MLKNADLACQKSEVDKLDIDKLETFWTDLSKLNNASEKTYV